MPAASADTVSEPAASAARETSSGAANFADLVAAPSRVFFPQSYDQTSPQTLPALLTIHGGGFCIGNSQDDDEWNQHFADTHGVLVVSLNYSKAPSAPFPTGLHDLEALVLAVLSDESLPIDRAPRPSGTNRTAILGFSAGGNLALAVSQLPSVHSHPLAPGAVVSVYGALDFTIAGSAKLANRPFKTSIGGPPRGGNVDMLSWLAPTFDWSYIPYGQDLRDPLLCPAFARREGLPPYVGLVAAELDMLAHESWTLACRLGTEGAGRGRRVPDRLSADPAWRVCGREDHGGGDGGQQQQPRESGKLELEDDRFAFEDRWEGGGVKWLLVPDVVHGFDHAEVRSVLGGGEATIVDAEMKTTAYVAELGRWLKETVWGL